MATLPGWRPGQLRNASDQKLRDDTDEGFQRLYTAHYSLAAAVVMGGYTQKLGSVTVTGTKSIATGLTTVTNVHAMINSNGAALNQWVTARPSTTIQGGIDIFVWAPTANNDVTPVASTTPWEVQWVAQGS